MPGKGRPKLPPANVRRLSIHLLVRPSEYAWAKKAAHRAGLSLSTWARKRLFGVIADDPK